jgi:HEAT repeat protein
VVEALAWASLAIAAAGALFLSALVARRVFLERRERVRADVADRLRPAALALLDGEEVELPPLTASEQRIFAELLGRYARALRGAPRERIARYFESTGGVRRELGTLSDRRAWRRAAAAFALGDMGSSRAVPALVRRLRDPEPEVRVAAARSLGRLGAAGAVQPLAETLADGSVPATLAGQALLEIGDAGLPSLHALLGHEEQAVRAGATELVGLLAGAAEGPAVVALLRDGSAAVRAAAAAALGRLGSADAAAALRGALGDRVPFVRAAAATALGRLGDRTAVPELLRQADDDDFEPARAAADALRRLDPELLVRASARAGAGPHVREAADLAALA